MINIKLPNALFHPCELDLHFTKGGGSSDTNTRFERVGTSTTVASHNVPSDIITQIGAARSAVAIPGTDDHAALITTLLEKSPDDIPGLAELTAYLSIDPSGFSWYNAIYNIATQDPYSGDYETNTQAAFVQRVKDLMSSLDSSTLRIGFNHAALVKGEALARVTRERSEDLAKQRAVDVQAALGAAGVLLTLEQIVTGRKLAVADALQKGRLSNNSQALEAGAQRTARVATQTAVTSLEANLRSGETRATTDNMTGWGSQAQSYGNWQAGISCCFIFLQVLNGKLPWFVRVGRAEFWTDARIRGYRRMAAWLVPLMERHRSLTHLVNWIMVRPFLRWGAWRYRDDSGRPSGALWMPVCKFWFRVWDRIGA